MINIMYPILIKNEHHETAPNTIQLVSSEHSLHLNVGNIMPLYCMNTTQQR